jgi:hypothetical protein
VAGDQVLLAVDPDWMGGGLHSLDEDVAFSVRSDQAYLLPPGASAETAPEDPEAA